MSTAAEVAGLNVSPFAPMDFAGRLSGLRLGLEQDKLDGLIVTNLTNVRYLSGFTGSAGVLLVTAENATLMTDGRYSTQAPQQVGEAGAEVSVEIGTASHDELLGRLVRESGRVALEADSVTWSAMLGYEQRFAPAEVVPTSNLVERLRLTKDDGELDRLFRAAAIADAALCNVRPLLGEEPTEREFALALDSEIRALGATGNSFETIVASGPNGALPHARPTNRTIVSGDLVVLDFGAVVDGYCSDMSRTVAISGIDADQQRMVDAVTEAQAAGVAAVVAGVEASAVDEMCREVLRSWDLLEYFTHGTGHGVGLDIHEAPRVSSVSDATLLAGFVVTVEPGVYLAPHGGVRIEDTVVVTASGSDVLTKSPKTLLVG